MSRHRHSGSAARCRPPSSMYKVRGRTKFAPAMCSRRSCSSQKRTRRNSWRPRASTRLDVLNYISHGISKVPLITGESESRPSGAEPGPGEEGPTTAKNPLAAYAINLTERAREGQLDPLIGRADELRRTMEILCRRRKNNPVFVGDAGVGKTALAEGLAMRLIEEDAPARLAGAEIFSLDTGALLAGTRFRGDFEERFKAVLAALRDHRMPILFIDEVHATVGAGATTGGTMDLATLIKPVLAAGELRVVGSTTFDEFKHIEKDRGLARRLQKVVIDQPTVEETTRILEGLRPHYEAHHKVSYSDDALGAAAKLANRHLTEARLPDSAIDVIDEAGAVLALQHPAEDDSGKTESPVVTTAGIEQVVARMARIPEKQASASDKERLRTLGESLKRVVFGQAEAVEAVVPSLKRARGGTRATRSSRGLFPLCRPDRRRQDRTGQAVGPASRKRVHPLRHERVHGEARGGAADWCAAGATSGSSRAVCWLTRSGHTRTASYYSTNSRRRTRMYTTFCCR